MNKLSLVLVALLIGASSFSQTIKVTCHDVQTFYKYGVVKDPDIIINSPDFDTGITPADCDYTFDLQQMTSTFYSRKSNIGSTIPIHDVEQVGSKYVLTMTDSGLSNPENTYFVKIYIDTTEKTMVHIWYDSYIDQTIVNPTGTITMTVVGMQ